MSGLSIDITVNGVDRAVEKLLAYDEKAHRRVEDAEKETASRVAERARMLAPDWIGELKDSIHTDGTNVVASSDHAAVVEYGGRPHMPPVSAVAAWAISHGLNPWQVAIGIKHRGTPAQPYMRPAAESERAAFLERVDRALVEAEL